MTQNVTAQPPKPGSVAHEVLGLTSTEPQTVEQVLTRLDRRRQRQDPRAAPHDTNFVKLHLNRLAAAGLVERTDTRTPAGRPCGAYALTPAGEQQLDLLAQLQETA